MATKTSPSPIFRSTSSVTGCSRWPAARVRLALVISLSLVGLHASCALAQSTHSPSTSHPESPPKPAGVTHPAGSQGSTAPAAGTTPSPGTTPVSGTAPSGGAAQSPGSPGPSAAPGATTPSSEITPASPNDVTVQLPDDRQYLLWIVQAGVPAQIGPPAPARGNAAVVKSPAAGPGRLWAVRSADNLLAVVDAKPGAAITLQDSDFKSIYRLPVTVQGSDSKPMDYARVQVTGSDGKTQMQMLTPANGGMLFFYDIARGEVNGIATRDKDEINAKTTVESPEGGLTLTLGSKADLPVTAVTTSAAKPEAAPPSSVPPTAPAPGSPTAKSPEQPEPSSPLANAGGFLFGVLILILFAIAVYWAIRNWERIQPSIEPFLEKLGIKAPEHPVNLANAPGARPAQAASPGPVSDPSICPFCGTRKDPTSGACACTLVPVSVAAAGPGVPAAVASLDPGPRLVTLDGPARGQIFAINGEVSIGREPGNTISLVGDTAASRHHARFLAHSGSIEVVDEGSSNGTFVNGARVSRQSLQPSDEIQIGHSRFRYEP